MVESGIDRGSQFRKKIEEPVVKSVLELSPALFDGIGCWRIRRERDEGEVVTGRQVRDCRRMEIWRSVRHDGQTVFELFA